MSKTNQTKRAGKPARTHQAHWQDNTRTERQKKRRDLLNQTARVTGFASWSAYETEVLNERVAILEALKKEGNEMNKEIAEFLEGLVHGPCAGVTYESFVVYCQLEASRLLSRPAQRGADLSKPSGSACDRQAIYNESLKKK